MNEASAQNEILRQLAEIQRSLGNSTATMAAMKEDFDQHVNVTAIFRSEVKMGMDSLLKRTTTLEDGYANNRQRIIGFLAAWSLFVGIVGAIWWIVTSGWGSIAKVLAKLFS